MRNSERRDKALERMLKILARLNQEREVSVKSLADEFGVTVRTIQNDLNRLKNAMDLPLEAVGKSGYWRFKGGFRLSGSALSDQEKVVMLLALDKLEKSDNLEKVIEGLKKKLMPRYERLEKERPLQIKTAGLEDYDPPKDLQGQLEYAIRERQILRLRLRSGERAEVEPYRIINFDDVDDLWYLFGKDTDRNRLDLWLLDDIEAADFAGESFYVSETTIARLIEERVHSPQFEDGEYFEVTVRADAKIAHVFETKKLSTQQTLHKEPDGALVLRFEVSHIEDVDNLIKSWLPDIEVLEPLWYRQKLAKELEECVRRLKS